MQRIRLLASNLNVAPLHMAIIQHPHLWDRNTLRTENEASPHHGLSDIWARFVPDLENMHVPQPSVWDKEVIRVLPLERLAEQVLRIYPGELGSVLITKINSGQLCKPHTDTGWHAKMYQKVAVMIAANEQQAFCFDDEFLISKPGDAFWFDNAYTHWVPNISKETRITAIFCIKPKE